MDQLFFRENMRPSKNESVKKLKMMRSSIWNLLALFLVLLLTENSSGAPFVLFADGWACISTSITSRNAVSRTSFTTKPKTRELKLSGETFQSLPFVVPWCQYNQFSLSASTLSISPFFDKPSTTTSLEDRNTPTSTKVSERENSDSNPSNPTPANDSFFIRPAMFVDMERASKIMADGFFKGPQSNWFTYQYEKFVTYLSLEANFPKTQQQRSRYEIFVACCVKTGAVWGIVEIDARGKQGGERTLNVYGKAGGSAYMCNLAVDEQHQRKGIATSLVRKCEQQVKEWYSDDEKRRKLYDSENDMIYNSKDKITDRIVRNSDLARKIGNVMSNAVCLKVRESNKAAVQMYLKLGYVTVFEEIENSKTYENILLMRKEL